MIAFTRPSVALTGYTNELMLHCPRCGDGKNESYLHLQDFNKNGEDVSLDYSCEFCGNTSTLHLRQHKGHTELLWDDAVEKPKPVEIKPLTGKDLLNKVREIGDVSKSELVEACGYIIPAKGNNKQRLHYTAFYEALLNAKGVDMDQLKKEASK